jgi:hypothetical protein
LCNADGNSITTSYGNFTERTLTRVTSGTTKTPAADSNLKGSTFGTIYLPPTEMSFHQSDALVTLKGFDVEPYMSSTHENSLAYCVDASTLYLLQQGTNYVLTEITINDEYSFGDFVKIITDAEFTPFENTTWKLTQVIEDEDPQSLVAVDVPVIKMVSYDSGELYQFGASIAVEYKFFLTSSDISGIKGFIRTHHGGRLEYEMDSSSSTLTIYRTYWKSDGSDSAIQTDQVCVYQKQTLTPPYTTNSQSRDAGLVGTWKGAIAGEGYSNAITITLNGTGTFNMAQQLNFSDDLSSTEMGGIWRNDNATLTLSYADIVPDAQIMPYTKNGNSLNMGGVTFTKQ